MFINKIIQFNNYTISGNTLTFDSVVPTGAEVLVIPRSPSGARVENVPKGYTTVTTITYTLVGTEVNVTVNYAGTCTLTLPNPVYYQYTTITIRTITANTVVSASSNVVPSVGGSAGTAILAATAGKWATLVSDGTSWQIQMAN